MSLVVTLWLSGVVIDWTFTSGGVDIGTHLFIDHCCVHVFIRMLNFHGRSQPRNYFNSEIFPIYGIWDLCTLVRFSFRMHTDRPPSCCEYITITTSEEVYLENHYCPFANT